MTFAQVRSIVDERCVTCHTGAGAPAGVQLDDDATLVARADDIRALVADRVMPPGNQTGMTDEERTLVVRWAQQGAPRQ